MRVFFYLSPVLKDGRTEILFDQREFLIGPSVSLSLPASGFNSNMIGLEVCMYNEVSAGWVNYTQGDNILPEDSIKGQAIVSNHIVSKRTTYIRYTHVPNLFNK